MHKIGEPEDQVFELELPARYLALLKGLVANPRWLVATEARVAAKEATGALVTSNEIHSALDQLVAKRLADKKQIWAKPPPGVVETPRKCVVFKATIDRIIESDSQ